MFTTTRTLVHVFLLQVWLVCGAACASQAIQPDAQVKELDHAREMLRITDEFYMDFPEFSERPTFYFSRAIVMVKVGDRRAHGECDLNTFSIRYNVDWWKAETNIWHKRKVVYHELAHCVLGLLHPVDENGRIDHSQKTIMNNDINLVTDGSNWRELVKELQERYERSRR